ncbi:cilia- and flagella-associated protein 73 [Dromaius novaehollandiae]|uniref:cilia- and flagella-associated protein 73 n=1 Tax=Dromaius novaehollandiae TaxID=8790 RepID=UPI00312046BD
MFGAGSPKLPRGWGAPGNGVVLPVALAPCFPHCSSPSPRHGGTGKIPPSMALDVEEYLRTAFRDKLRLQKAPAWAAASLLPSTRLLLKRRQAAEAERALQAQRQAFRQRMASLEQRRRELARREEQLAEEVRKFDAFLEASAAKRERALRRARQERERAAQRGAEAARLRGELAGLLRRRRHLGRRLRSHRVFGDYLRSVLARAAQFPDVPAMLARFRALAGARAALARRAEAGQERLAAEQARLRRYREEAGGELLRRSNELAQLQARLEAARREVQQEETHWTHIQTTAVQKTLLLGQIRMAVLNLFQLATKQLKVPADVALEDTEAQLDTVLLCMQDLAAICAELCPGEPAAARKRPPLPPAPPSQA